MWWKIKIYEEHSLYGAVGKTNITCLKPEYKFLCFYYKKFETLGLFWHVFVNNHDFLLEILMFSSVIFT